MTTNQQSHEPLGSGTCNRIIESVRGSWLFVKISQEITLLVGWIIPGLVGLVVCIASLYSRTDTLSVTRNSVNLMASNLLGVIGVVTAILVAIFTAVYVQGRRNQVVGFENFFSALNELKQLDEEARTLSDETPLEQGKTAVDGWVDTNNEAIKRLDEITPGWPGYDRDPTLEDEMESYVHLSGEYMKTTKVLANRFASRWDRSVRGMLIGLRIMDEGAVENDLAKKSFGVLISLTVLLTTCVIIRTVAGLENVNALAIGSYVNVLVYVFLPTAVVTNLGLLVYEISRWRLRIQKRDKEWE